MNELIMLTEEDRMKFAAWCAEESRTTAGLAEQVERLMGNHAPLVEIYKADAIALERIAKKLYKTESQEIRGSKEEGARTQ